MTEPLRLKVGSVAFLPAMGAGYLIGLDESGHRVEAMGDWRALSQLAPALEHADTARPAALMPAEPCAAPCTACDGVYAAVESWQVIAVDGEVRVDLSRAASLERAAFVRAAVAGAER